MSQSKASIVGTAYSNDHWASCPDVYKDLVLKDRDRTHPVPDEQSNRIFRAVLVYDYLRTNLPKGARVLDIGCGLGFNTCFLIKEGYDVSGFDVSEVGIERSRKLASDLGLDPNIFTCADQSYLDGIPDASVDAILGMGFIYYLDDAAREQTYRNISRVLKPNGLAALTLTNKIFDAFALNNTALSFWAELIDGFSGAKNLLPNCETLTALTEHITVPQRKVSKESISQRFSIHTDNPLTYTAEVKAHGLIVEEILYPDCHLLPPFLESNIDKTALAAQKAETCIQRARDWRGLFMDYEFLALMRREKK